MPLWRTAPAARRTRRLRKLAKLREIDPKLALSDFKKKRADQIRRVGNDALDKQYKFSDRDDPRHGRTNDWYLPLDRRRQWREMDNRDEFWEDYEDGSEAEYPTQTDDYRPEFMKPLVVEEENHFSGQPSIVWDSVIEGPLRQPRLVSISVQRTIHHMWKTFKWSPQKLSQHIGISVKQIKRFIMNGQHEDQIVAEGGTINESLSELIQRLHGGDDYYETRSYMMHVYCPWTQTFGFQPRQALFGTTDDDHVGRERGYRKRNLHPRKIPTHGRGSGKVITRRRTRKMRHPMQFVDITEIGKYKREDIYLPVTVRQRDGVMRELNIDEMRRVRRRECPVKRSTKFSPH